MKKILTYGTFDLLHYGHINILKRAKALGDYLVVGVSTDQFNEIKGKKTLMPYEERVKLLEAIKYVDKIIPEKDWKQKTKDIKDNDIDIFVMGDDWKGKFDDLPCEVKYFERTHGVSSTLLKKILNNLDQEK